MTDHCGKADLVSDLVSKKTTCKEISTSLTGHNTHKYANGILYLETIKTETDGGEQCITDPLEHISCTYTDIKCESITASDYEISYSENNDVDTIKSEVPIFSAGPVKVRKWDDDDEDYDDNDDGGYEEENVNPTCNDCQVTIEFYEQFKCQLCTVCFQERSKKCNKFKCSLCSKSFQSKYLMSKHIQYHSQVENYECNLCDYSFCTLHLLQCHYKLKHVTSSDFKCPLCTVKCQYSSLEDLFNHINTTHAMGESISQRTCNEPILSQLERFGTQMSVVSEEKTLVQGTVNFNETSTFPCPICKETFGEEKDLAYHMNFHPKSKYSSHNSKGKCYETSEKTNLCNYCGKFYRTRSLLHQHVTLTHEASRSFKCKFCDKSYKRSSVLQNHVEAKHEMKTYQCKLCGNVLSSINSFHSHMKQHTTKNREPTLQCPVCPKMFKLKKNIVQHMRVHTGETPYKCSYCTREFTNKWNRLQHERLHRGEKLYKCEKCGKAFTHNVSKKNHMKYHKDVKDINIVTKELDSESEKHGLIKTE